MLCIIQLDEEDNEQANGRCIRGDTAVYYCGDEDDGHAKKEQMDEDLASE